MRQAEFTSELQHDKDIVTVGDVVKVMERAYPLNLAEKWDHPGLIAGDPQQPVSTICYAVDLTPAVLEESLARGADMIITHHPVLFRPVHTVAATTPKGALIHRALTSGCALYCAHTNADNAHPGVNDALAEALGLTVCEPLVPRVPVAFDRWVIHVPGSHVRVLQDALFAAGAGKYGDYAQCSFRVDGEGQFYPLEGAQPYSGSLGSVETVREARLEVVALRRYRDDVRQALLEAHPYEEPSYDILESHTPAPRADQRTAEGSGRIAELPEPMTLQDFTHHVARCLPATVWGVRAAGDPERVIKRVALCGGAGDSFLSRVQSAQVDCYITSDLRHHPVDDHLQAGGPAVIDTAHAVSEYPWLAQAAALVSDSLNVTTQVLDLITDPWTIHAPSPVGEDSND